MKYFIDTNIIIDFLNKDDKATEIITNIAKDEESKMYINRIVTLETLRTIHFNNTKIFKESEEILENFESLEIKPKIYEDAISFSRYCHSKGVKLKGGCEAIDFLHFITGKYYSLEIITNDKDFDKLEKAYKEFVK